MKKNTKAEHIISLIIGLFGIILFTVLLVRGYIGATSYCVLIGLLACICLAISWGSRLLKLNLKDLTIVLSKYEKVKDDIYAKEEQLKRVSVLLSEILIFNTFAQIKWQSEEAISARKKWNKKKVNELIELLNISGTDKKKIYKYSDIYDEIDNSNDGGERIELAKKLQQTLDEECNDD